MRQLELDVLDQDSVRSLAAGERVQIISDDMAVAEIVPLDLNALADYQQKLKQSRAAALSRLSALMEQGIDMGGFRITNRDELYDRG